MVGDPEPELFAAALAMRGRAYTPYSHFDVGAALRTDTGEIFACCNVENAAYPESVCAEGGLISMMVAGGGRRIDALVTVCDGEILGTPCGGCRQKIREFAGADTIVYAADLGGIVARYTMDELLPDAFGPEHLLDG